MDLQAFGGVAMNLKTALPQGGLDLLHYRRVTRLALFLAGRRGKHTQGQKAQALAIISMPIRSGFQADQNGTQGGP